MSQSTIVQRWLEGAEMIYSAEIIAGALMLPKSRIIADLHLQEATVREDMSKGGAR